MTTPENKSSYLIGAIDLNHNGDEGLAKRLIDLSVEAGLDAVKFQKRTLQKIWTRRELEKPFLLFPELGKTVEEVYQSLEFTSSQLRELRDFSRGKIDFLIAPFDLESLKLSVELEVNALKIDPPYITNIPFLKAVAAVAKKVFLSVAACSEQDLERAVEIFRGTELVLLHSVHARSIPIEETCLGWLKEMKRFGVPVGYSDCGPDSTAALAAVALGASAIEKPFTFYHYLRGFSHAHSLDADQLRKFVKDVRAIEKALWVGGSRRLLPSEVEVLDQERPALFAAKDIQAGEAISTEMLEVKAPGRGLTPHLIDFVVGRRAVYDIKAEEPITFGLIE